jgi:hypothetical protein
MTVILWDTNALALALAEKRVPSAEKFRYLLISYCMYAASGYVAWLFITPPSGWLYWYEGALVLIVTYFGLLRCKESYEGAPDDRLLEDSVILGVPLGVKLILFTWLAHWLVRWGFSEAMPHVTITSQSALFPIVSFLISAIGKFYPFLITAIGTGLFFLRLAVHLKTIAGSHGVPNPSINTDAAR